MTIPNPCFISLVPRMKITVVANAFDFSEVAMYRALAARGHRVHVLHDPERGTHGAYDGSSVTHAPFAVHHRLDMRAAAELRRLLSQATPDLVYAPNNKTLAVSLMATRRLPTRVVGYRGTTGHLSHWDPASRITYFHPRLAGIVCLSRAVEDYLVSMRTKAKLITTYKGFDLSWYNSKPVADLDEFNLPKDAFVLGFTGNVRPVKGIDVLLKALALLPPESRIHLLLIGQIRCRKVQRMLKRSEYTARVRLAGFRPDAYRLTGRCKAFVMPSVEREGLCRAVVEAMAQGVPPIVSDVGGMPELVENGISGIVVAPSDPAKLAAALLHMESAEDERTRMGTAAMERIRSHFGVKQTTDLMEAFFLERLQTTDNQRDDSSNR